MKKKICNILIGLAPLIVFIICWEYVLATSDKNKFLFASPSLIFSSLIDNIKNGVLLNDLAVTGQEALLGFLLGNFVGALLGLSLWYSKKIAAVARPYIIAIGAIPIFSITPMMIIWFGTGLFSKVMMAAFSTVVIAIIQCYEGARNVDNLQIKLFQSFGASKNQIFFKLIVPSSLAWLFNSLKLNVSFALLGAFIGEFVSSDKGLGHRILKAGGLYDIPLVLASVLCIILLAFFFTFVIYTFEKTLLAWK